MKHCCEAMQECATDVGIPLNYYPVYRLYGFTLKRKNLIETIFYCPWCGIKLPNNLYNEHKRIITEELGFKPNKYLTQTPRLPEEFKSDEWWKKRKL